jgi:hypothetical protein
MKKIGVFVLCFALLLSLCFVIADTNSTNSTISTTATLQQNQSKIDNAYSCLESKVRGKCSTLSTQEISLSILAVPSSDVLNECKTALESKKDSQNCWPSGNCNIKDTAFAILALNSVGADTSAAETWLLSKTHTPTDLTWFLEQDSNEATKCIFSYSGSDYTVNVGDTKKISSSAGPCLSLAQSSFWLQVASNCYDNQFSVSCDKQFVSTLLYKYTNSPTIYVSSDTKSAAGFGSVSLKIGAKCFSSSSTCDYEASLWATMALLKTQHDVSAFIPYVIALSDSQPKYFPEAFIYILTNTPDYGTQLVSQQKLGNYWEADSSANGKFYDTAVALQALKQSSSQQVINAKDWLLFSQDTSGCWISNNLVRDTAMSIWALTTRTPNIVGTTTYCSDASYFCIPSTDCPSSEKANYFCSGLSSTCCQSEHLKPCSDLGQVCSSGQVCSGNSQRASDTDSCCIGNCQIPSQTAECENQGYSCRTSCLDTQEGVSYSCNSGQVCCRTKTQSSSWWIWFIIILIILVIAAIAFVMRDKIKLWWFNFRNKVKKEKPSNSPPSPRGQMPLRPYPVRRPIPMQMPVKKTQSQVTKPQQKTDDIFKKLRELGK